MKNKQVKQMICDVLNIRHGMKHPFGFFFMGGELMVAYIAGSPPDDFYDICEHCKLGTVSLTANQLKGK